MRQQTADRMLALFDEHGWWQPGRGCRLAGRGECLRTAAYVAAEDGDEDDAVLADLQVQIRRLYPGRVPCCGDSAQEVVFFNDHPDTDEPAVRRVTREAVTR